MRTYTVFLLAFATSVLTTFASVSANANDNFDYGLYNSYNNYEPAAAMAKRRPSDPDDPRNLFAAIYG